MRHSRSLLLLATGSLLATMTGCAGDTAKSSSETPSASTSAQVEQEKDQPVSGEVQERAVQRIAPGVVAPPTAGIALPPVPIPGEFALRTLKGFYVTAIDGGGRIADPILVTASTTAGPWEKFKVAVTY